MVIFTRHDAFLSVPAKRIFPLMAVLPFTISAAATTCSISLITIFVCKAAAALVSQFTLGGLSQSLSTEADFNYASRFEF